MVVSLDHLQEQGGPVLHGFGEDLKEIALVVKVNQDFQFLKRRTSFRNVKVSEKTRKLFFGGVFFPAVLTCKTSRSSFTLILAVLSFCRRSW